MIQSTDLPDSRKVYIQTLEHPLFNQFKIRIDVLRLDKIHTIISGNKWFKLKYYLIDAASAGKKGIITFGGYYSNHLLATAYACKQMGFSSIGIIRGEKPASFSPTLKDVESYGMKIQFVSRPLYKNKDFIKELQESHPDFLLIEEGGQGFPGTKGAEEILQLQNCHKYTHIICAVGTGTMITGIINASLPDQEITGIICLKINRDDSHEISNFIHTNSNSKKFNLQYDFHFGGYAKKNEELIQFMNQLYHQHGIPTDFVYTAKLFYGSIKLVEQGFFAPGANILIVHSGGIQGNRSLPPGVLDF